MAVSSNVETGCGQLIRLPQRFQASKWFRRLCEKPQGDVLAVTRRPATEFLQKRGHPARGAEMRNGHTINVIAQAQFAAQGANILAGQSVRGAALVLVGKSYLSGKRLSDAALRHLKPRLERCCSDRDCSRSDDRCSISRAMVCFRPARMWQAPNWGRLSPTSGS